MLKPRAARVAELLEKELGVETAIERGGFGEFTVLVGSDVVAKRTTITLPRDKVVLDLVRSHMNQTETLAQ